MNAVLGIYTGHDANLCAFLDGEYHIIEAERVTGVRHHSLIADVQWHRTLDRMMEMLRRRGIERYEPTCYGEVYENRFIEFLRQRTAIEQFERVPHHTAHAACAFYQSPFDEALIMSFDGGGPDTNSYSYWQFFIGNKGTGTLRRISDIPVDMGTSYLYPALAISDIGKPENWLESVNSYAGKLMGLSAYGTSCAKQVDKLMCFYSTKRSFQLDDLRLLDLPTALNTISGQEAYNLAASNQTAFEQFAWRHLHPLLIQYSTLPLVLTGGCALNVLFNQKLRECMGDSNVFIPPNPNDSGLAFGALTNRIKPTKPVNITYAGAVFEELELVDGPRIRPSEIARLLAQGRLLGFVQGNSEVGPRALGNRSILCDPGTASVKDRLNSEVKFREWFRPFAPVVQAEHAKEYFEMTSDSPYMSFAPRVRPAAADKIPAVVHKDNTARVQTVTRDENAVLHEVLGHFGALKSYPILLNTSFNSKGRPLVNSGSEVLAMLKSTGLDGAVVHGKLILKP